MNKRGQTTLFIIIAVVIVAIVLIAVFLWPTLRDLFLSRERAAQILASQVEPLREAVSSCVEKTSHGFFERVGLQAGYYDITGLETLYFAEKNYVVVVFKDSANRKINKLPSIGQIEMEYQTFLEKEGNAAIDSCLNNFRSFKRKMEIEPKERRLTARIYNDVVIVDVDWPIVIRKRTASGVVEQVVQQKQVMLLIPFGYLWNTANRIVDCETRENCKYEGIEWDKDTWNNPMSLRYISKEARSLNKDQIVFILESIPYRPGERPYKFNFAIDRS